MEAAAAAAAAEAVAMAMADELLERQRQAQTEQERRQRAGETQEAAALLGRDGLVPGARSSISGNGTQGLPTNATAAADDPAVDAASGPV